MIVNIESPVRKVIIESSLIMKRSESALYELMIVSALQVAEIRPGSNRSTDILLGFIQKYSSKKAKVTMTLKQNYMPWSINIGKGFSTEPLTCGLYVNTVFGDQFWVNEPERYPKGYYGFSSKVRFHVFMGQRLTYDIDPQRRFLATGTSIRMIN